MNIDTRRGRAALFLFAFAASSFSQSAGGQEMPFSGTATCPLSLRLTSTAPPAGTVVATTNVACQYTGLTFGGQAVVTANLIGVGRINPDKTWKANGIDIGTVANGDQYRGEWQEDGAPAGTTVQWQIVAGSGVLEGIRGKGVVRCAPPRLGIVTCSISGKYTLPGTRK